MSVPSDDPTAIPTLQPSQEPTADPTESPTTTTSTTSATPAPTHHSAKKWAMLNPRYKGGDGELLWHIYYGDYSDDERFDKFREDQMWDADVVRPLLDGDKKYGTLNEEELAALEVSPKLKQSSKTSNGYGWWILLLIVLAVGAMGYWYKHSENGTKLFNAVETQSLLNRTQDDGGYIEY